jgi:SAM-dependent methyltransferase
MSLRFYEIAEANHQIQNPFTHEQLNLLGDICRLEEGTRHLDLACGKGEMLSQWALKYGTLGVGVDISEVFIEAAKARAYELEILDQVNFIVDDAGAYPQDYHQFDVVSCIGATWIGGGLVGTLNLMKSALKPRDGLILVGEPYWYEMPSAEIAAAMNAEPDTFATLEGTLNRIEQTGLTLVEMVLATLEGWDRYEAQHWWAVDRYLYENPDDPSAAALRSWITHNRRTYLTYGRKYMGWGVFVLRA